MNPVTQLCRQLRNNATQAERLLWDALRRRSVNDAKFLRQYPLFVSIADRKYFYIADFYCVKHKLVIEVDGPIHQLKKEYDRNRDIVLQDMGCKILRVTNDEVINNIEIVIRTIKDEL